MCVSYAHLNFFPYKFQLNENAKAVLHRLKRHKYFCEGQWDKLRYDFPVFTISHYGEQAVSFKMVDLPKSLLIRFPGYTDWERRKYTWEILGQKRTFAERGHLHNINVYP